MTSAQAKGKNAEMSSEEMLVDNNGVACVLGIEVIDSGMFTTSAGLW